MPSLLPGSFLVLELWKIVSSPLRFKKQARIGFMWARRKNPNCSNARWMRRWKFTIESLLWSLRWRKTFFFFQSSLISGWCGIWSRVRKALYFWRTSFLRADWAIRSANYSRVRRRNKKREDDQRTRELQLRIPADCRLDLENILLPKI